MGTVPAVGEDTGKGSDIARTDDLGLGTCGSWWYSEEGRGILIRGLERGPLSVVSEGVTWLMFIRTMEPYYDRQDSRLPQIRVRCLVDVDRLPSSV